MVFPVDIAIIAEGHDIPTGLFKRKGGGNIF
jgi:hypothetical protein